MPEGLSIGFTAAASLASEMMEARDERRLLRFQKQMAAYQLLIIDELGFVPLMANLPSCINSSTQASAGLVPPICRRTSAPSTRAH